MSSSIYSVCIGPQSSCQSHSEEGAECVCVWVYVWVCVCVPVCACVRVRACMLWGKERKRGGSRELFLQPQKAMPVWGFVAAWLTWGSQRALQCLHAEGVASRALEVLKAFFDIPPNMGCSLCSAQKQEEQYKLLYEVCQVTARGRLSCGYSPGGIPPGAGIGNVCVCLCSAYACLAHFSGDVLLTLLRNVLPGSSPVLDFESLNSCWWSCDVFEAAGSQKLHDNWALYRAARQEGSESGHSILWTSWGRREGRGSDGCLQFLCLLKTVLRHCLQRSKVLLSAASCTGTCGSHLYLALAPCLCLSLQMLATSEASHLVLQTVTLSRLLRHNMKFQLRC
jgi:hypothetical protein